ncbi:MAG: helix-turn-helix domain-containing protein [Gemmatimonadales bacterium]|jgi:sugar-specific transcriptional regulator TrmB
MDLDRFGFTPTEAKVYLALLPLSPATGYAVAQSAKLARANTYDALEGLAGRGAVTRLPGRPVRYAAMNPDALVGRLRREYSSGLDSLADALSQVRRVESAVGLAAVESLADRGSLLERAIDCARSARSELLAVVGPWAAETFADLEAVRDRVSARVLSLGTPAPAGAAVREVPAREIEAYWGGLPVALVADRRRAVCGIMRSAGDAAGIATEHPGVIPFVRHLLRRELASASPQRVS